MKKGAPFLLIVVLAMLVLAIRRCQQVKSDHRKVKSAKSERSTRGFQRQISLIAYTPDARCSMQCNKISKEDIEEIMQRGTINYRKTNVKRTPCPVYTLQGFTNDREQIQVVFEQCPDKTNLVTCSNLNRTGTCDCPGDEKKQN